MSEFHQSNYSDLEKELEHVEPEKNVVDAFDNVDITENVNEEKTEVESVNDQEQETHNNLENELKDTEKVEEVQNDLENESEDTEKVIKSSSNTVKVKFPQNTTKVEHTIMATGGKGHILATNKQIKLIPGRLYEIPVNCDLNSDDFDNIKVFSDISHQLEIRYVKNGYACVYPLINKVALKDDQRLCVLIGE
ncbi:MAG: hypothetical protein ACOC1K_01880 [Nanoarchaeota archaeon]